MSTASAPRSSAKAVERRLFPSSTVRNKVRRQTLYKAERLQRNKERRLRREKKKKEREQLGDKVMLLYFEINRGKESCIIIARLGGGQTSASTTLYPLAHLTPHLTGTSKRSSQDNRKLSR